MRTKIVNQLKKILSPNPSPTLGRWNSVVYKENSRIYSLWATEDHSLEHRKIKKEKK